jgi:hypothetical protein
MQKTGRYIFGKDLLNPKQGYLCHLEEANMFSLSRRDFLKALGAGTVSLCRRGSQFCTSKKSPGIIQLA